MMQREQGCRRAYAPLAGPLFFCLIEVVAQALLQAQGFCMWLVLSAQFLATSTSSVVAGLPDWLYHLYTIVSFFNISSSYVGYEGCESGYRFQSSLVIMIGASLLAMAQATLLYAAHKRSGLAAAVGLAGSTMNALYSVVLKQSLQFLHCSPSAHGGFDFTGGVATNRVELLPDGTTLSETVYLRYAPTWLLVASGRMHGTPPRMQVLGGGAPAARPHGNLLARLFRPGTPRWDLHRSAAACSRLLAMGDGRGSG